MFEGTIGWTVTESTPHWPRRPAKGAPNVVVLVLDDTGLVHLVC
jgi:arylsulfatase